MVEHKNNYHTLSKTEDSYAWLRDPDWPKVTNPEIIAHLEAENNFFKKQMQPYESLQEEIFVELKQRIIKEDQSYPVTIDQYQYFYCLKAEKDYPILYRKNLVEEEILDWNKIAQGKSAFAKGDFRVNIHHSLAAFSFDDSGEERYRIYIKDLTTQQIHDFNIENTIGNIVWNKAGDGFYYCQLNDSWRADKVMFFNINTKERKTIYSENNPVFFLKIEASSSKKYLIITSENSASSEVFLLSLNNSLGDLKATLGRKDQHLYQIDHINQQFVILTNDQGENFRLTYLQEEQEFQAVNLVEVIAHSPDNYLVDFALYNNFFAVTKRILGINQIEVFSYNNSNNSKVLNFVEEIYEVEINYTHKDDPYLRLSYSSLAQPNQVLEYDFLTQELSIRKVQNVGGDFVNESYQTKRIWATSKDGTKIPISLVYRKNLLKTGGNPVLLYGYGSYGMGVEVYFRQNIISLLDRGFVYAIAHIRGGDELGYNWYLQAKFLNKTKTFFDFIAAAEELIAQKFTSKECLSILGGSAGGMLVGAVINLRPDLFAKAVALVPFVDVLNTMLDETLPLTPPEFEEWGNPKEKEYYQYIKSYSPYDNVLPQNYPKLLVTCGLTDPRVAYWEAAKWVAKLRELKTDKNILLLKCEMDAGHMGQSGRYNSLIETAMIYSFIVSV